MTDEIRRLLAERPTELRTLAYRLAQPHSDYLAQEAAKHLRTVADELDALLAAEPPPSEVLQAVLDAISGKLDPSSQIADHPNVKFAQMARLKLLARCSHFRPDHNGECLNCDEWADAHTPDAIERGRAATEPR